MPADALRIATRDRMAAELLDVLAHELAGLALQAGAARRLVDHDVPRAREVLVELHRGASDALRDARRLVALDPRGQARRETPSLASLHELADAHTALGHAVTLHRTGAGPEPPPAFGMTAYAVVRETLAHLRRATTPGAATIAVRVGSRSLGTSVVWAPGAGEPPLDDLLVVLEERAAGFGGLVEADDDDGWRAISVRLPLREDA